MAETEMTMTISRTLVEPLGTLADLVLTNTEGDLYHFGEFTGSGMQWERSTATSPWVHGRRLRSARKSPATLTGELYVVSPLPSSPILHDDALGALLEALSQWTWTLQLTAQYVNHTQTWIYDCEPADVTPGESKMLNASSWWTTLQVSIPHSPVIFEGAW